MATYYATAGPVAPTAPLSQGLRAAGLLGIAAVSFVVAAGVTAAAHGAQWVSAAPSTASATVGLPIASAHSAAAPPSATLAAKSATPTVRRAVSRSEPQAAGDRSLGGLGAGLAFAGAAAAAVAALALGRRTPDADCVAIAAHSGVQTDAGGLEYVALSHPSGASAKIFLFGADVTSYIDAAGTEWIAVRPDSKMDGSKPISGGLSHCFPQFGPGPIQQHGFARNVNWAVTAQTESSATFELVPSEYTRKVWDHPFRCRFTVTVQPDHLDTEYVVENTGSGGAFDFQAALHSYFAISSIGNISVGGSVKGKRFLNKMASPPQEQEESRDAITIAEEYDRVYYGLNDPVLRDTGRQRQLRILNESGWKDTVLWNPFGNQGMGYDKFVCVESVAYTPVTLKGGERWVGRMALKPELLGA
jgi:glucose-6-phosphate 1-epimerase